MAPAPSDAGGSAPPVPESRPAGVVAAPLAATVRAPEAPADLQDPLRRGDVEAVAAALTEIPRAESARRAHLEAAIQEAAASTKDTAALRRMLGSGNAFLHGETGRKVALRIVALAGDEAPEQSVMTTTRLLEAAMQGPIEKNQVEARACVDAIYAAHQERLNRSILNPAYLSRARTHEVKARDSLEGIAKQMRKDGMQIEAGTLALVNRITDPGRLRIGQVLKAPVDPIRTVVEKRSYLMAVYLGETMVRLYWIAHGKDNRTPETTFVVGEKKEKPDWFVDGRVIPYGHPENVLGEYFVKFEHRSFTGFGAHGTSEPDSIGTMASKGCLRLRDADIAEYFRIVPRGTEVEVRATGSS